MNFDVYCDESQHDLLCSSNPKADFLVIGSLWLETADRVEFKEAIHALRHKYRVGGEFKWVKVSPSRLPFYLELVQLFLSYECRLRYRCIVIERQKVNLVHYHNNDQELGFYKFYYQMLHHWILDFNRYAIFCDAKKNRCPDRLQVLQRCLQYANLSSEIFTVQAIRSDESVLIQLCDVLTGAASAKMNGRVRQHSAKARVIKSLEEGLFRSIAPTYRSEQKFNVFLLNLNGGW